MKTLSSTYQECTAHHGVYLVRAFSALAVLNVAVPLGVVDVGQDARALLPLQLRQDRRLSLWEWGHLF